MTDRQSQEASFANPDLRMIHPASTIMLDETIMGKLRAMTVDEAAVFSPMAILHDDTLEEKLPNSRCDGKSEHCRLLWMILI